MAEVSADILPVTVTLWLSKAEADALYFLLENLPDGFACTDKLKSVHEGLEEYRRQLAEER